MKLARSWQAQWKIANELIDGVEEQGRETGGRGLAASFFLLT